MATGKIKTLVYLSQQRYLPNMRLVRDHNDKGFGLIEALTSVHAETPNLCSQRDVMRICRQETLTRGSQHSGESPIGP